MPPTIDDLVQALTEGERDRSLSIVSELVAAGTPPEDVVTGGIERAMEALDRKCTAEQFNLLEIMLAGRAVTSVIRQLFPDDVELPDPRGHVVVAVPEGDIHDIGKAILKVVLSGSRFRVVDCGKDASIDAIVTAAVQGRADAVCVSGLISSVIPHVRTLKPALARAGLTRVKVLAGGAALKQCSADTLEVDFVGQTAFDAVSYLNAMVEAPRERR